MNRYWPTLVLLIPSPLASQAGDAALQQGQRIFEGNCVRCHGMAGTGGEGPTLARPFLPRARDDEGLASVIRRGISGTGMPGAWRMSDNEVRALVGYVRSLGRVQPETVAGDAARGKSLFETKGECTECHTIGSFGSNLGPDLSRVGLRRGTAYLRESVINPGASLPQDLTFFPSGFAEYLLVRVVTREGQELEGLRINEDTFTIQLRDEAGDVHSFRKEDLTVLDKQFDSSLMPDYRGTFSDAELDDLVAYLTSLRGS